MPGVDAPAASCVMKTNTRVSHHRSTGATRHSRTQWFYGLLRALPGDQLDCHRRLRIWYAKTRLGLRTSARLDASIAASEPHDFTVREKRLSSACHSSAHGPF